MVLNVLIVEDSQTSSQLLIHIIESDPDLKVAYAAKNGEEALAWLQFNFCDVITMDIHMPGQDGFAVTRQIMKNKPIPIIIISSAYSEKHIELSFKAMSAGALAILEKPVSLKDSSYTEKAEVIVQTIKMVAGIKLIKRRFNTQNQFQNDALLKKLPKKDLTIEAIAIGASLGGPPAIASILSELKECPVPIFVVQHISSGFTEGFIQWLKSSVSLPIVIPRNLEKAKPGVVYIPGDHSDIELIKNGIITTEFSNHKGPKPSVNKLFYSMASCYGEKSIGIILTGMGDDGAKGLLEMKKKGAYTIAQDEASSILFGMAQEAILMNAITEVLPLNSIGKKIKYLLERSKNALSREL